MHEDPVPTRRSVVGAAVLGMAGAGSLAACGSDAAPPAVSAPAASTPAGNTPAGSAPASPADGGSGVAESSLAALADVPVGGAIGVEAAGGPVIIARPTADTVVGFSAVCPHQGCTVAPRGATLNCPCHGSKFETATGKMLNGPATTDLKPFAVKVDGSSIIPA